MGMIKHMGIAIAFMEKQADHIIEGLFTDAETKQPLPVKEVRAELKRLREAGLEFIPCCDNTDTRGLCLGAETGPKDVPTEN